MITPGVATALMKVGLRLPAGRDAERLAHEQREPERASFVALTHEVVAAEMEIDELLRLRVAGRRLDERHDVRIDQADEIGHGASTACGPAGRVGQGTVDQLDHVLIVQ